MAKKASHRLGDDGVADPGRVGLGRGAHEWRGRSDRPTAPGRDDQSNQVAASEAEPFPSAKPWDRTPTTPNCSRQT